MTIMAETRVLDNEGNSLIGAQSEDKSVCETGAQSEDKRVCENEDKSVCETEDKSVCETRVNGTCQRDGEDLDIADGFISHYFKSPQGTYSPREYEKESWGTDVDEIVEPDDQHEKLYELLKNTAPKVRWREGLCYILKENKSEASTRKCLSFLHSNAANGIKAAETGRGRSVDIEHNSALKCLTCADWMTVIEGLNFEVTSPGTVRNIEHVNVVVGQKTDTNALAGFCYLVKALLDLTWTNLQTIPQLEEKEGQSLHHTLAMLCSGCGIDDLSFMGELESKYPFLMKSLGFRRNNKQARLQWQLPDPDKEFRCLCLVFHGLFRSADNIESVL